MQYTNSKFERLIFMVKTSRLAYWAVILGLFISSLMGQAAAADRLDPDTDLSPSLHPYIGLYGGLTSPERLHDVRGTGNLSGVKLTDLTLARSTIFGAKLGLFPSPKSWVGIETEFFYTNPHVKQQDITFSGAVPTTTTNFAGAHVRVATWAVNLILRYPGDRVQPYIGVGPGIFWGRLSGVDLGTGSDTSLGLNALGGVRLLLTQWLAVFGEYKYNRVTFDFGGVGATAVDTHALYQAHHFVGGLSLQF
jgi:opacity protein-like surface antigen